MLKLSIELMAAGFEPPDQEERTRTEVKLGEERSPVPPLVWSVH
jgi:hypothetical protein